LSCVNVLVTGSSGFIGKNLIASLERLPEVRVLCFDREHAVDELGERLAQADFIYHLAGVNRPQSLGEFRTGNVDFTAQVCEHLLGMRRSVPFVLSSSVQAALDNPYGVSKREAEEVARRYAKESGARVVIYRLKNVFGKWCRPNYNSVVATFCHNIARNLPITISDPSHEVDLIHIDDVVHAFMAELGSVEPGGVDYREAAPSHLVTLGRLADLIGSFRKMRETLIVPDFSEDLTRKLYGTYLSYLDAGDLAYRLGKRSDQRGCLAEFVKSTSFGQVFVSRTASGITRGDHYHHTKAEKFLVLEGEAVIRFRHILEGEVTEYRVRGEDFCVLDIPPGCTHSIENVGRGDLITLFWASEIFDAERPDTNGLQVLK
jgi:UDP-2-acetamido-2,6-beta-L-arabino-hexul-4-ose reductase